MRAVKLREVIPTAVIGGIAGHAVYHNSGVIDVISVVTYDLTLFPVAARSFFVLDIITAALLLYGVGHLY